MARIVQAPRDDHQVTLQPGKATSSRLARSSPLKKSTAASTDVTTFIKAEPLPVLEVAKGATASASLSGSRSSADYTSPDTSPVEAELSVPATMAETLGPPRKPALGTRSLQRPGFSSTATGEPKRLVPRRPGPPISTASGLILSTAPLVKTSLSREASTTRKPVTPASTPLRAVRGQTVASSTVRTPNTAPAARPASRVITTTKTPSQASRSGGNINTPGTKSLSSSTMPRPPRPAAQTSSPTKPPLPKPSFTTYQRSFSPSKPLPPTPASSFSRTTPMLNTTHLRPQTHLLHLSLLHDAAGPTLAAYTSSAHANLLTMHRSLQTLYTQVLVLERQARQTENMLTLHRWTGGNVNSVGRRLNVLCAVLRDVMTLTAPSGRMVLRRRRHHLEGGPQEAEAEGAEHSGAARGGAADEEEDDNDEELVAEQKGPYAILVADFTAWTTWVQAIWRARDKESDGDGGGDGSDTSTASKLPSTPSPAGSNPLLNSTTIMPIDPLGDAPKASLRSLTHIINALLLRLNDLPAFPASTPNPKPTTSTIKSSPTHAAISARPILPTPVHLLTLSLALLTGMQEELQLMREIEFEIVVGEEAWTRQRLGRLAGEVERGFGTPAKGAGRW